ncbi:MAG: hypothetical protein F4X98_08915 [Gammaproteobacteria bacterium]|nr:hypothetical protein [Gammaproteobacteria bacterium]
MTTIRCLLSVTAVILGLVPLAEEAEPLRWTLDEFRTRCIPLWSDEPTAKGDDCTVAEFGEIVELDGSTFYYARYHDGRAPDPGWFQTLGEFNVLVILRSDPPDREAATVFHVRKPGNDYGYLTHFAPELIRTQRGPILYLKALGPGGSDGQYDNHQYWLWRSGGWVLLDALSWVYALRERMPNGYSLGGIRNLAPALETMNYATDAYRAGDSRAEPTGGTVTIYFEWDDLTLQVARFEHDPNPAAKD